MPPGMHRCLSRTIFFRVTQVSSFPLTFRPTLITSKQSLVPNNHQLPHNFHYTTTPTSFKAPKKHLLRRNRNMSERNSPILTLDGRTGEGGGQIIRIATCLSALTGIPVHITNVRGNRGKKNKYGAVKGDGEFFFCMISNSYIQPLTILLA